MARRKSRIELKVKKLNESAVIPDVANDHDAGLDIYANESVTLLPGERGIISTGLAMQIPVDHTGIIKDRSSVSSRQGLEVLAGVIDSGYRGEIGVVMLNTNPPKNIIGLLSDLWKKIRGLEVESNERTIQEGDKIAQMVIVPTPRVKIIESDELDESERGDSGFGSSGSGVKK